MIIYNKYSRAINQQFSEPFNDVYKSSNKNKRTKLLPCLPNIYRRWYYSALIEDTSFSPANLFESLNRLCGQPPDLSPNIRICESSKYPDLSFEFESYNTSSHPVVADFRTIIEYCQPDIDLTEADAMPEEAAFDVAKKLHMQDQSYAAYLLALAMEMDFFVKIPSIHVNRAQLISGIEKRINLPDEEMFDKIVQAALRYASRSLNELVPLPQLIFDEEYLINILKNPAETDAIFQRLYDTIGVDIDDLVGMDIFDELDVFDMAIISGTYLLGILLDKYFLTPFGHYLKLIRPIYMIPFNLENEINSYLRGNTDEDELGIAFYAPCSRYYLTNTGLNYFNVEPTPSNYMDIENKLPFAKLTILFDNMNDKSTTKSSGRSKTVNFQTINASLERDCFVYSLKIKYLPDPRLWLNMEASDTTTIHRVYTEMSYYFDLDRNGEYTFFPDNTENPFLAYVSPKQAKRSKKTNETTLGSLTLQEKHTMILSVNYPRMSGAKHKAKWLIEVTKIRKGKEGPNYPIVTRLGKALREFFEWQ
ncbi:MAG: hypothetical protein FWC91_02805 [Defluviitaleaceae bacterium]|nr:hypothetical protein [Defluviitaleaceae bacterium]